MIEKKARKLFENGYKRNHFFFQINGEYRRHEAAVEQLFVDSLPTRQQLFNVLIAQEEVAGCVVAYEKGSQGVKSNMKVFVLAKKRNVTQDVVIGWVS